MPRTDALEWCDGNMHRNYPVVDSKTPVSLSGVTLPSSFLVDIDLHAPGLSEDDLYGLYVSRIDRLQDSLQVVIGLHRADGDSDCGVSAPIPLTTRAVPDIQSRTFAVAPLTGGAVRLAGSLIVGTCADMLAYGNLRFTHDTAELISLRVHTYSSGVDSITVEADAVRDLLQGNIVLRAGDGVSLAVSEETVDGVDMAVVTVSRVPTDAEEALGITSVDEAVAAITAELGMPVRRINGVAPDSTGNVTIAGGDCTDVSVSGNVISISNPCSKPCCDDTSLADAQASLTLLEAACARLENYYQALTTNVNAIQARLSSLIASRR